MLKTDTNATEVTNVDRELTSYSSQLRGPSMLMQEAVNLVRAHFTGASAHVASSIEHLRRVEDLVSSHTGVAIRGLRMLDVGAGQRVVQMTYFAARGNTVVGIDRDVIVQGLDLPGYVRMWRSNGFRRFVKTVGRKLMGVDLRYRAALRDQLGATIGTQHLPVHQMDATQIEFEDESFDAVYSLTVLQYVSDPAAALREMARLTRPGGIVFAQFLPFSGVIGSFDIRAIGGDGSSLPEWSHLRPRYASLVREAAFLNRVRISEWRAMFEEIMPGCAFIRETPRRDELEALARDLQDAGELLGYEVDELVTNEIFVAWSKPQTEVSEERPVAEPRGASHFDAM